ncbi:MAG: hypothetical protein BMS9Abin20_1296 [Acidimicrobiia bacterium]|nr:MAG: hypothetical protein BMS9Abin20_1296 [Acidimicrobiia bacterium]
MIPTVLIVGVVFGFVYGVTHRIGIVGLGAGVAVVGWWLLLFTVGDLDVTPAMVLGAGFLVLVNYAVAALAGWGLGHLLRTRFGMTTE